LQAGGCDVNVLHVFSPALAEGRLFGPVELSGAEDGRRIRVHVTDAVLRAYRRRWEAFRAGCQRTCRSLGAIYVAARSNLPLEQLVLLSLRRAGVLAR
jgi:hypothetical protein